MKKVGWPLILIFLVTFFITGCNQPPVVDWVDFSSVVTASDSAQYLVSASDPEGEWVSVEWFFSDGTVLDTVPYIPIYGDTIFFDRWAFWVAPPVSGDVTVRVVASDESGKVEELERTINVEPLTTNLINDNFTIAVRDYEYLSEVIGRGYTVSGTFSVTSEGSIDFYVMDSVNFAKWTRSETAYGYVSFQDSGARSFSFKTPQAGTYYFVMVNYDFYDARRVHLRVDKTTP